VKRDFGWPELKYELRVRTSIDSTRRKAADEQLFAWKMLKPYGLEWVAGVDTSRISGGARRQLESLLRFGVEPLGKTKALAKVVLSTAQEPAGLTAPYVLTLQTPALLIDPSRRLARDGKIGTAREEDMSAELQDVWSGLSDGSLRLANYYQRCELAGGEYFRRRFLGTRVPYKPYLLSLEGSTFLLEPVPGKEPLAIGHMNQWRRLGLPLSRQVLDFYGIPVDLTHQWKHCPYLPENGYGEVAVNEVSPYREE
jgi:hypothetical protein